jgi:hypothetical protein
VPRRPAQEVAEREQIISAVWGHQPLGSCLGRERLGDAEGLDRGQLGILAGRDRVGAIAEKERPAITAPRPVHHWCIPADGAELGVLEQIRHRVSEGTTEQ